MLSDLIHKDKLEIGFMLEMQVGKVEARIWKDNEAAIKDQLSDRLDEMWLNAKVENLMFSLTKH